MVNVKFGSSLHISRESFFYETMLYESSTINCEFKKRQTIELLLVFYLIISIIIMSIYYLFNMCQAWTEI